MNTSPHAVTIGGGWTSTIVERDATGMRVLTRDDAECWRSVYPEDTTLCSTDAARLYQEMASSLLLDALTLACVARQDDAILVALDLDDATTPEVRVELPEAFSSVAWAINYQRSVGTVAATDAEVAAAVSAGRYAAVLGLPLAGRYARSPLLGAVEAAAHRLAVATRDHVVTIERRGETMPGEVRTLDMARNPHEITVELCCGGARGWARVPLGDDGEVPTVGWALTPKDQRGLAGAVAWWCQGREDVLAVEPHGYRAAA